MSRDGGQGLFLGISKMKIVDAVQVHVLRVPGEGGLPAAKVEVGCIYSADLDPVVLRKTHWVLVGSRGVESSYLFWYLRIQHFEDYVTIHAFSGKVKIDPSRLPAHNTPEPNILS